MKLNGLERDFSSLGNEDICWINLPEKKYCYWADPFIYISPIQEILVFVEYYDYRTKKGTLECLKLNKDFEFERSISLFTNETHVSFPSLFEFKEKLYIIPETHQKNEIAIYEFNADLYELEKVKALIRNIKAADSIIHYHNGKFYLFTTRERENRHDELALEIYYADALFGDWKSHLLNPVKIDDKTARNAGNIFIKNNKMYRPTQNCYQGYGKSISIMEITTLSESHFSEKRVKTYDMSAQGFNGMHTMNFYNNTVVFDVRKRLFTPMKKIMRIKSRLNPL